MQTVPFNGFALCTLYSQAAGVPASTAHALWAGLESDARAHWNAFAALLYASGDAKAGRLVNEMPQDIALWHSLPAEWVVLPDNGSKQVIGIGRSPEAALDMAKARNWQFPAEDDEDAGS